MAGLAQQNLNRPWVWGCKILPDGGAEESQGLVQVRTESTARRRKAQECPRGEQVPNPDPTWLWDPCASAPPLSGLEPGAGPPERGGDGALLSCEPRSLAVGKARSEPCRLESQIHGVLGRERKCSPHPPP